MLVAAAWADAIHSFVGVAVMSACQGCGRELVANELYAKPRKWCSEKCRKRHAYGGLCIDCGARTNGAAGKPTATRCRACSLAHQAENARWTRTTVIDAIREWTRRYGAQPSAKDWNATATRYPDRYATGEWPSLQTVQDVFGSWSSAIAEAGLLPRRPGQHGTRQGEFPEVCAEIRRRYEAGESPSVLAGEYGCAANTIRRRILSAGGCLRTMSDAARLRWKENA